MVPCPWARDAAAMHRGEDVGVHLTLNSEWGNYRWGPITHSPSLLDGDGGFPRTVDDVWDHADLDEVRKECRAQVERAIYWGFDVSHLDSHMGTLQLRPAFFDVYLETAIDFGLPLRMAPGSAERLIGFPYRRLAAEAGVVFPDHFVQTHGGARPRIEAAVASLAPGVTEVYVHPAVDSDELRASHPDWEARIDDYALVGLRPVVRRAPRALGRDADRIPGPARSPAPRADRRGIAVTPDELAALCAAAMPEERLTVDELAYLCFGANDPGAPDEIFGDENGAAVMQTQHFGEHVAAWLVLVVVRPDRQSAGRGKELVQAVIERAREIGAHDVLLAERDAPLPVARCRHREHESRDAPRVARVRARLGRHQHGHPHVVAVRAAERRRDRTGDRPRRPRLRRRVVSRSGSPSSTVRCTSGPRSQPGTATGARSDSRAIRSTGPAGSGRWRPIRPCSTAASARR